MFINETMKKYIYTVNNNNKKKKKKTYNYNNFTEFYLILIIKEK
jgi:hypothetical protein